MKRLKTALVNFAVDNARLVAFGLLAITVFFASFFPNMAMDTDPENMLESTEPVRVFHNAAKKRFDLSETIVVGLIKENDPSGVFNPQTLTHVNELTRFAKTLRFDDPKQPGKTTGVIEVDMVAPSVVDYMHQAGPGAIAFECRMQRPPATEAEALAVRDKALSNPLLVGQMVSADGKAFCLYPTCLPNAICGARPKRFCNNGRVRLGRDQAGSAFLPGPGGLLSGFCRRLSGRVLLGPVRHARSAWFPGSPGRLPHPVRSL